MRRRALLLGVATSALVVSIAGAYAPMDQYAKYNRDDVIIHDNFTHLDWERAPNIGVALVASAQTYCATLQIPNDSGGPWRLPTYKELLTLVDERLDDDTSGIVRAIDLFAFPGAAAAPYWSSSPVPQSNNVLCVDFTSGIGLALPSGGAYYVRCVRSTP
jgi:hypothetical protein